MAVLQALRRTPRTLARSPVLFAPVLALLAVQSASLALRRLDPLVASLVSVGISFVFLFVGPFFTGGIIGMADEALDGRTSLATFFAEGRANYLPILLVSLVLVVVNFALGVVAFVGAISAHFAVFGDVAGGGADLVALAVVGVVGAVGAVVVVGYLSLIFLVQFYAQAIVVDDLGAVGAVGHSVSVVRTHPVSTVGYSVLVGTVGGLFGAAFGLASILVPPTATQRVTLPAPSLAVAVGVALLALVLGTLAGGFLGVYSVSFYRAIGTDGTPV